MSSEDTYINLGINVKCEIGGFVCVGRNRPRPIPDAYFAYPEDAGLFMAAPKYRDLLMRALPYIEQATPPSCGQCSTPNAMCDGDCVSHAAGMELYHDIRAALKASLVKVDRRDARGIGRGRALAPLLGRSSG